MKCSAFLLILASAGTAQAAQPVTSSPLMDGLRLAGASLRPRAAEFSGGGPKPIYGAFLQHLHDQLRAAWSAVPAAARAAAEAASMRPLGDTPSPMPGPYWRWVPIVQGCVLARPPPPPPLYQRAPLNWARSTRHPNPQPLTPHKSDQAGTRRPRPRRR